MTLLRAAALFAYPGGMARAYDVQAVESKWQRHWIEAGTYQIDNDDPREKFYALCMYPYPSGPAHQGHVRNYTFGDLVVRYQTMQGKGVLSPIGFDSFGLPAENAAIKTGTHPRIFTDARIAELTSSLTRLGAVYDWRRQVCSHDPAYIKWSQAIFLRLWEAGLAYRALAPVNWCPGCQTVLANEQVLPDGTCERSGDVVEKRDLEQWFLRITKYADELLEALDDLEWPERAKMMQRNWIGRSEGAEFDLAVEGRPEVRVRGVHHPARHQLRHDLCRHGPRAPAGRRAHHRGAAPAVDELRRRAAARDRHRAYGRGRPEPRSTSAAPLPAATWSTPSTAQPVPLYVADYVLMGYGTGAIMAVPAEDERDCAFATSTSCPSCARSSRRRDGRRDGRRGLHRRRRQDQQRLPRRARHRHGEAARHRVARGARASASARSTTGCGTGWCHASVSGAARSRSSTARRTGSCRSPRTSCRSWRPTTSSSSRPGSHRSRSTRGSCTPRARSTAGRPGARPTPWTPSSTRPGTSCASAIRGARSGRSTRLAARNFMPVDQYIGGIEHAILHLLYAALLHPCADRRGPGTGPRAGTVQALPRAGDDPHGRDEDVQVEGQPRRARALLRYGGGRRPPPLPPLRRAAVRRHGLVRPDGAGDRGVRPLSRPALAHLPPPSPTVRTGAQTEDDRAVRQAVHRTIADVTRDIERWSYNTAVAHCMELLNFVQRYGRGEGEEGPHGEVWNEALDTPARTARGHGART